MAATITLKLTEDEAEMILDALDSDAEGYTESANEARKEGDKTSMETFREAAGRIVALRARVQSALDG